VFVWAKEQEKQRIAEGGEIPGTWAKTRVFLHKTNVKKNIGYYVYMPCFS